MSRVPPLARCVSFAALAVAVAWSQVAHAGPIFLRGTIEDGQFVAPKAPEKPAAEEPAAEKPGKPEEAGKAPLAYTIRYATIAARIQAAKLGKSFGTAVELEESIVLEGEPETVVAIVPLPKGAPAKSARVAAGRTSKTRKPLGNVQTLVGKSAEAFLENLVKETGDVGFAAFIGRPLLVVPAFPLGERTNVAVTYTGRDPHQSDVAELVLPLPQTKWSTGPVERLSITAHIDDTTAPLRAIFSPTHPTEIDRTSLRQAVIRVRQSDAHCENDFRVMWVEDDDDLGLRLLPFRLEGEDDGYFALVGNPTGRADGSDALDKDITFVLDTSGSMRGEKIEQCRAAIEYCLEQLGTGDRFNIVTFGTAVRSFQPQLVAAKADTIESARDFVDGIVAHGRTNIGGALETALAGDATEGRPRITIFLTDGTPTAGQLVPEKILETATAANVSKSSVYVLGVGHDVNVHLLDRLAESTEGAAEFVEPEEEIDVTVAGLYDRLAHPVLTDVTVDFGELETHSLFPRKLPALYRNSQIMLFGRYREGGAHTATVSGTLAGVPRSYKVAFEAPANEAHAVHDFVPPLWASRKIGYLLQEMRLHGEDKELLEEVVRLSKKYGIVTEYTQFVAMRASTVRQGGGKLDGLAYGAQLAARGGFRDRFANNFGNEEFDAFGGGGFGGGLGGIAGRPGFAPAGPFDEKAAVETVTRQLAMARKQETGRWAFNQARNDKDLQSRLVTTGEANAYVDRRGQKVDAGRFVKHIGGRCFYLQNGQWCEAEEAGERKERVVKLYGKEYFELLRTNEDFRRAQKLGWAISINIGDERVVVEKDGKRSDLPEPPKTQQVPGPRNQGPAPNVGPAQNQIPVPQINNRNIRQQRNVPEDVERRLQQLPNRKGDR